MNAQCLQYFLAGQAPLISAISHIVYYLSKFQDVQDKIFAQISSNQNLSKCDLFNSFIKESMRLSPPLFFVEHVLSETINYNKGDFLNLE